MEVYIIIHLVCALKCDEFLNTTFISQTYFIQLLTMEKDSYEIPLGKKKGEGTYFIPMDMNNIEGAYDNPMYLDNVEGTYDKIIDVKNVEAKVPVVTKETGYMKTKTVLIIFLVLIIIIVGGVCVGVFFAGKATANGNDDVTLAVTTTIPNETPISTQYINVTTQSLKGVTCPTLECPIITCPTPASSSSTSPTPENNRCLDAWVTHGVTRYFFGEYPYTTLSEAVSFCKGFNATLIEVDSESENKFVKDYLSELKDPKYYYWMGLTDITTEGTFLLYSSNETPSFFDWPNHANGEPNNGYGNEDCVAFDQGYKYSWNDIVCANYSRYPICEL